MIWVVTGAEDDRGAGGERDGGGEYGNDRERDGRR